MEKRLSNIFKTASVRKSTNVFLRSYYKLLQVTSKTKTREQPFHLLKTVEFWPTFDIQISITVAIF